MNLNVNNIEKGMEVYGSDGHKIGSIAEVYHGTDGGGMSGTQGMQNGDVVLEEVDIVEIVPDDVTAGDSTAMGSAGTSGPGSTAGGTPFTGTQAAAGTTVASGATGSDNASGVTWNSGAGSTGDIGAVGTANDQNTSPGYVAGGTGVPTTMTGGGYIHVEQGGILGIGSKDLYIPITEVQDIDPGNCVSLTITKHQADENFQTKPDFLENVNA